MLKRKTIAVLALSAVMICSCAITTGCEQINGLLGNLMGPQVINHTLTWEVDPNVTVAVEGQETLPTEWVDGEAITFAVTVNEGYELEKVSYVINEQERIAREQNGAYQIAITGKATIKVTVKEEEPPKEVYADPTLDKFELVAENDVPYGVISGTYDSKYTVEEATAVISAIYFDVSQYSTWKTLDLTKEGALTMSVAEGKFTVKIDLSEMTTSYAYFFHVGDSSTNWSAPEWEEGQTIAGANKVYSLGYGTDSWATSLMSIYIKDSVTFAVTGSSLAEQEGVAYLVLSGTWDTTAGDVAAATAVLSAIKSDLQQGGSWKYSYPAPVYEVKEDGTFTFALSLAETTSHETRVWYPHFNGAMAKAPVVGTSTLTIGNLTYTLTEGSNTFSWLANVVCVKVTENAAA